MVTESYTTTAVHRRHRRRSCSRSSFEVGIIILPEVGITILPEVGVTTLREVGATTLHASLPGVDLTPRPGFALFPAPGTNIRLGACPTLFALATRGIVEDARAQVMGQRIEQFRFRMRVDAVWGEMWCGAAREEIA